MLISFSLMGAAMVILALTPSVAVIGMAAPVIVIICRLAQGFALGGEVGPSTAYLIEAAPPQRRGLFVSFQYVGQQAAVLAAGLIGFGLSSVLSPAALDAYGWRIAMLVGAVIVPFGLSLRKSLPETLHAPEVVAPATAAATSRVRLIVILGFLMLASGTTVTYVSNYLKTYATETLHLASDVGFLATITSGLMGVILCPIGSWLSDRYGRRTILLPFWSYLAVVGVPVFAMLDHLRSPAAVVGAAALLGLYQMASPSVLIALTESLPKHIRGGAVGLIYALAIAIFGGSTQFTVAWLTGLTHSNLAPAWYMTGAVVVGVIAMLFLPETAPRVLARRKG
jgi:MFS family permease